MATEPMAKVDYRPEIDGLRTIAVLAVIIFHFGADWLPGGYVGVDVFFVISGYLITQIVVGKLDRGTFDVGAFFVGRAKRLVPALAAAVAITLAIGVLLLIPPHLVGLGRSAAASLAFVSNFLFWNEAGYFDISGHSKPLLHTWSLSVEMQFYLVWPFVLMAAHKLGKRAGVLFAVGVLSVASLAWNLINLSNSNDLFYLPQYRVYEFGIGAALSLLPATIALSRKMRDAASWVGIIAIAFAAALFSPSTAHPGFGALLPCMGAALVIFGGRHGAVGTFLSTRLMTYLGQISYSLYLVHWPIIVLYFYWRFVDVSALEMAALFLLMLVTAAGLHHLIERPLRGAWKAPMWRQALVVCVAVVSFAGLLALSVDVGKSDGWEWRVQRNIDAEMKAALSSDTCAEGFGLCPENEGDWKLFGDSHSNMLTYWASAHSVRQRENLQKINPLPGCVAMWDNGTDCQDAMNSALGDIEKSGARGVYLFSNWNPFTHWVRSERVIAGVGNTVARLRNAGIEVTINGSMPFMERDPTICTSRPFNGGCPVKMVPVEFDRQRAFNEALKSVVLNAGGSYIDLFDELCDAEGCLVSYEGLSLYGDRYHFSGRAIGAFLLLQEN